MNGRQSAGGLASVVLLSLATPAVAPQQGAGEGGGGRPTLTVLAPGINSTGSGMFSQLATNRPLGKTYRIRLVSPGRAASRARGVQRLTQPQAESDDPDSIRVIEATSVDAPRLKRFIEQMVRERDVTVVIDMDLSGPGIPWNQQTTELAGIIRMVAEERARTVPASFNSIIAHSAGTVGLSKFTRGERDTLFHEKMAAAPQTDSLAADVLIVHAVGDLPSTHTGRPADLDLAGPSRDAQRWLNRGNPVLRVHRQGFSLSHLAVMRLIPSATPWVLQTASHARANLPGLHDHDMEVLLPVSRPGLPGEPPPPFRVDTFRIANASALQVAKVFAGRAGPLSQLPGTDSRHTEFDRLKEVVQSLEPPRGGGIALQAAAELPVDPAEIVSARWEGEPGRIVLLRRDGGSWKLPRMHAEIARTAWRSVFGAGHRDPEFSIGASLVPGAADVAAQGRHAAYYLGPVESTLFGLVLIAADLALTEITYGSSRELAERGLDRLSGYHSLPEMFPEKYSDPGEENRFIGGEDRVVLQSLPSRLVRTTGGELAWARVPELAVRFGRTTPAERGYAALFAAHYFGLVEKVAELRDLLECARAVGTFKWLRQNGIPLSGDSSLYAAPARFLTPHQVDAREPIPAADLAPLPPLVRYGEHGPVEIHPEHGGSTRVGYRRGRLRTISRPDGRTLTVHTDGLGQPVAVEADGYGAAVLLHGREGELTLMDDVVLFTRGGWPAGFRHRPSSRFGMTSDAWELVEALAHGFIESRAPWEAAPPGALRHRGRRVARPP